MKFYDNRYPHMKIFTTLLDSHFYVFSRWVLDLLVEDKEKKRNRFSNIKTDFIPYLVSCQGNSIKLASKLITGDVRTYTKYAITLGLPASAKSSPQELALSMSSTRLDSDPAGRTSCYATCISHLSTNSLPLFWPRIFMEKGYCMRVNTIQSYLECNRDVRWYTHCSTPTNDTADC